MPEINKLKNEIDKNKKAINTINVIKKVGEVRKERIANIAKKYIKDKE